MWKYKKQSGKQPQALTEEALSQKAIQRILMVSTAGLLLLLFDFFIGFDHASIPLQRGDQGAYLIRPDQGAGAGRIDLRADIETEEGTVTKEYELILQPVEGEGSARQASEGADSRENPAGAMSADELLAYEMRNVISSLNDDLSVRRVSLPDRLRTGERISWGAERRSNTALISLAVILLAVFIYSRRLDPLEKLRRSQTESVRLQLPEFASRLVMLLGAGLVLSAAFERIVEESSQEEALKDDYFYSCMAEIYNRIKETNGSMEQEFRAFAGSRNHSGQVSGELMRISNIISDNISKGVELTDNLQSESEALWLSRKRDSEERGRLAETKLTMPLTVFLLVLIVITISPALLEL